MICESPYNIKSNANSFGFFSIATQQLIFHKVLKIPYRDSL